MQLVVDSHFADNAVNDLFGGRDVLKVGERALLPLYRCPLPTRFTTLRLSAETSH
jgi:hypothetical protein